jgi:hypothetical protein
VADAVVTTETDTETGSPRNFLVIEAPEPVVGACQIGVLVCHNVKLVASEPY